MQRLFLIKKGGGGLEIRGVMILLEEENNRNEIKGK